MGRGKGVAAFLVGATNSGTSFHVTNAGRDALLEHLNKGVPARYEVEPGSDLARWLVLLDEKKQGRVPKSLRKLHARALAAKTQPPGGWAAAGEDMARKRARAERLEVAGYPVGTMREQLRRQLVASGPRYLQVRGTVKADGVHVAQELITGDKLDRAGDVVPSCSVCREDVGPGGRKTEPALCARCYQRERRGLPPAAEKANGAGRTESITVQVTPAMKKTLKRAAAALDESISTFVENLIEKAIAR